MSTPATAPISMQLALSDQVDALLHAAGVVLDAPFSDDSAFQQIMRWEADVESVYAGYAGNPSFPVLTADSQQQLKKVLDGLQSAIDNAQATSLLILGAAQLVSIFRGRPAPTAAPAPEPAPAAAEA